MNSRGPRPIPPGRGQDPAVAAQVQGAGKRPGHVVQSLGQALGDLADQEIVVPEVARGPVPVPPHEPPVEDVHRGIHDRTMAPAPGLGKQRH